MAAFRPYEFDQLVSALKSRSVGGSIICNLPSIKFVGGLPLPVYWKALHAFFPDGAWRDFVYDDGLGDPTQMRDMTIRSYKVFSMIWEKDNFDYEPESLPWLDQEPSNRNLVIQIKL